MRFYRTILKSILSNLTPGDQKKGIWIIVLMVFNALLDFFSVAAFLPLIAAIIDPEFISGNSLVKKVYAFFGFTSHATFVVAITIGVLVFVLVKNLISLWIANAKARYAFNIRSDLSSRALMNYMQSSFLEFTTMDFAREVNKITSHPLAFANNIILSITTIISEALVSIFILGCMVYYDYKILVLVIFILLPILVILRIRKKGLKKISNELKTTYPLVLKYSSQMVEGFVEVNTYQKVAYFYQRFQKVSKRLTEAFIKDQTLQAGTIRLTEIIIALVMCSLIIYSLVVQLHYQETLVLLGIYAGASFRIVPSVNRILHSLQQIRTNEYLFEEFNIPPGKLAMPLESDATKVVFAKTIALNNISFQYPEGPNALQCISMTIRKGEKVAITGESGEGKTTLLLVLLGFLQQTAGELLVDGKQIHDKHAWHKLIGYVSQTPYILDGTVAENIAFGTLPEKIDRARVLQLTCNLGLSDLIQQLPNGIDTHIGERGAKLSGGQRQRLAIARALYADASILLLDEVTNQVHGSMELEILNLLNQIADKNKTIIMVSHKIPTSFFNTVYHLEKGKLYEVPKA